MSSDPTPPHSEALRESEARVAAILETALDCIITIDHIGRVLDFNPAAERTFGYSRAEAIGREMAELIVPPHLRERHRQGIARAASTGKDTIAGRRIEIVAMRKGGEEFPVELTITRIALNGAHPLFTGHIRDITERRLAERRQATQFAVTRVLAEATSVAEATPRLLRAVCEGLNWDFGAWWYAEGEVLRCMDLWSADPDRVRTFESATREAIFSRGVGLPGRIWSDGAMWIPDVSEDQNFPRSKMAAHCGLRGAFGFAVRLGESVLGVIEFFSREARQEDSALLEMFDTIGAQFGLFIERRRAEDQLRQLNIDLERRIRERTMELAEANLRLLEALEHEQELGQLKSNFVSLVSHEFRTPLGIILSSSEILQHYFDTLNQSERQEQLEAIKTSVLRMSALMEEVLLFSRMEAGKFVFHPEPVDLVTFCQRLCDELRSATYARCPIIWRAENDLSGVCADEKLLQHLFTNLLVNAVKYSSEGSPVEFTARRAEANAVFCVRDHGIGIPTEAQAHLFDAFFRARNAADRPGTGLGLVVVRRCVELHGGSIVIESTEGAGTTVHVTLPLFPVSTNEGR
jgi:two-component system, cell cycle sensor histidine kinase and response regulator CckA